MVTHTFTSVTLNPSTPCSTKWTVISSGVSSVFLLSPGGQNSMTMNEGPEDLILIPKREDNRLPSNLQTLVLSASDCCQATVNLYILIKFPAMGTFDFSQSVMSSPLLFMNWINRLITHKQFKMSFILDVSVTITSPCQQYENTVM